jgi:hypothetical protein
MLVGENIHARARMKTNFGVKDFMIEPDVTGVYGH